MAEAPAQERTEQATPKRLLDARKKGQVPRSKELATFTSLLGGGVGLLIFGSSIINALRGELMGSLDFGYESVLSEQTMLIELTQTVSAVAAVVIPVMALILLADLVSPALIGGWVLSLSQVTPKLERISPLKGIGRLFSPRSLVELIKAIFKFLLVTAMVITVFVFILDQLLLLSLKNLNDALESAGTLFLLCFFAFSSVLTIIVLIDVPFQIWDHAKQLRMTRQEVKDEMKETEGRPEVKSVIREKQQAFARQRMMSEVPKADVVLTNPTHVAVALKYDRNSPGAPVVVAKGLGLVAQRIREIAEENDVVIFSAPPLARALYASTDLNDEVPSNLFVAVAQVLAYVFKLQDYRARKDTKPKAPQSIEIPDDYFENDFVAGSS